MVYRNCTQDERAHEENTARTYLYFWLEQRPYFQNVWRELDAVQQYKVIYRLRSIGVGEDEIKQIERL